MSSAEARFRALLAQNAPDDLALPVLDANLARRLLERTEHVPFFAHSYALIRNLDHGGMDLDGVLDFTRANGLDGLCLHINDGGAGAVGRMSGSEREAMRRRLEDLHLSLHLEISSSTRDEVERARQCALDLGVRNIRLYARHEGRLSEVLEQVYADLGHVAEVANRHGLNFDFEQHEDLKSAEIAALLERIDDPRINALFDYTNALNAHEEPLEALSTLAPVVRQAHIKGGRKIVEGAGWGQMGVEQGSPADELPGNRLLYELIMLGEGAPQVICLALEQEVGYVAAPFRLADEGPDPNIRFRAPSDTPLDRDRPLELELTDERRWAQSQVQHNRAVIATLREIAASAISDQQ
jgi:sugar phosphate isomerase/epimerase